MLLAHTAVLHRHTLHRRSVRRRYSTRCLHRRQPSALLEKWHCAYGLCDWVCRGMRRLRGIVLGCVDGVAACTAERQSTRGAQLLDRPCVILPCCRRRVYDLLGRCVIPINGIDIPVVYFVHCCAEWSTGSPCWARTCFPIRVGRRPAIGLRVTIMAIVVFARVASAVYHNRTL